MINRCIRCNAETSQLLIASGLKVFIFRKCKCGYEDYYIQTLREILKEMYSEGRE